jgi:hypothetical protein
LQKGFHSFPESANLPGEEDALRQAEKGVELWDFRDILRDIAVACRGSKAYFADDTLRTVQLLQRSGGRK